MSGQSGSKPLKWRQVHAWRLAQHGLSPRLQRAGLVEAVRRTGGIQAQVMSAAEVALWARAEGLAREDVRAALWSERALVKTWAMRATLHLLPAADLPLYSAARSVDDHRNWAGYFAYYGLTSAQHQAYLEAVPEVLGGEPMTREELAVEVARLIRAPKLRRLILSSGWGSPLKPSAFRGDLAFGPNRGQSVTFVNPRRWLRGWKAVEPYPALREIARRYLTAYGPTTREAFERWWGLRRTTGRKLFASLEAELEAVDVEGWRALALRSAVEAIRAAEPSPSVNLVPLFDAYTFGFGRQLEPVLAKAFESVVFRPQGWVTAAVVVDGCIRGVWERRARSQQASVAVRLFAPLAPRARKRLEVEAERLGAFLGVPLALRYE